MSEIEQAIERLVKQHGGLRKAGRAIGIKAQYLCRLRYSNRTNPSDSVLRKLGLKRQVSFESTTGSVNGKRK